MMDDQENNVNGFFGFYSEREEKGFVLIVDSLHHNLHPHRDTFSACVVAVQQ